MLDLGTGTGSLARLLAARVGSVLGTDPSDELLRQARAMAGTPDNATYRSGVAEEIALDDNSLDLVSAGQCWHWFDADRAAREIHRVLIPGGRIVIAHFDWLALPGNVVEATESLISTHNPAWQFGGGTGIYPCWLTDLTLAGFDQIETFSFDVEVPYSHEAWVGRIRASAGIGASLPPQQVAAFSSELVELLAARFPTEPLTIPHRAWAVHTCRRLFPRVES